MQKSTERMLGLMSWVVLCVLGVTSLTQAQYTFSLPVGRSAGTLFATEGNGRITALRVWEIYNNYIAGFQLRYDYAWGPVYGRRVGQGSELELFDGETIVQLSGKYDSTQYVRQLMFVTNRGRSLVAGQPSKSSFNFYPSSSGNELLILSGTFSPYGIISIGAHWGPVNVPPAASNS